MDIQQIAKTYVQDPNQKPNYDGFVVIGAGLPRTGTMSMRAALGQLLDGACHHMINLGMGTKVDWDFWNKAALKKVDDQEWVDFLEKRGFRSGVDYPISMFYKELMQAFPKAKVVLTIRNPETWQASVESTLCKMQDLHKDFAFSLFNKLTGSWYMMDTIMRITDKPVEPMGKGVLSVAREGKEPAAKFFNEWVEEVKRVVPKDRLLVFEVKQGWKPLCEFLDLPIPEGDFPRVNDTKQLQGLLSKMQYMSYIIVYGLPFFLAILAGYWLREYIFM